MFGNKKPLDYSLTLNHEDIDSFFSKNFTKGPSITPEKYYDDPDAEKWILEDIQLLTNQFRVSEKDARDYLERSGMYGEPEFIQRDFEAMLRRKMEQKHG